MARILVCETHESTGKLLVKECEEESHIAKLLAKEGDDCYVLSQVGNVVLEFLPDYMIIDHLRDHCFEAIQTAKSVRPGIVAILHTTHLNLAEEARINKIPFYKKHNCQAFDNMFMDILMHERGKYTFE